MRLSSGKPTGTESPPEPRWEFQVFVVGRAAPHSQRAVLNLQRILDRHLRGGYDLKVIDLREQPELAAQEQLIVIPAVVRKHPPPSVRLTGDFSDEARVIGAFGLEATPTASPSAEGKRLG
ncbi:MAG: circadian clock KaiB family protein [Candidatus Thermoplasmatota archaeon]